MKEIAFIFPYAGKQEHVESLLAKHRNEIIFAAGARKAGVEKARELIEKGVEVIISRGETGRMIRDAFPEILVVVIPITGIDLAMALDECKQYGSTVAVVSYAAMIRRIEQLAAPLSLKILKYELPGDPSPATVNKIVDKVIADGAQVILGGYVTPNYVAKERNIPYVVISTSDEAYIESFHHARSLLKTIKQERSKSGFIEGILGYAYEGIVSIDMDGGISWMNKVAERILKHRRDGTKKVQADDICPEFNLRAILEDGREERDNIVQIKGKSILCNKAPILAGKKVIGAVTTFQEIDRIENMEKHIRKEMYAKGHIVRYSFDMIQSVDKATKDVVKLAKKIAQSDANVVVLGETGTGKEVFAQSIHQASRRRDGPFVAINCAALPANLLESELFGYVEGAFTGAKKEGKRGLFEIAHKGTLFLDEIAEIDVSLQSRLLRVLQERAIMRLGSDRIVPVDVRIIAATHNDLQSLVKAGKFRQDLYYRLNILALSLPPLRDRPKDIAPYARTFIAECSAAEGKKVALSPGALKYFEQLEWPGNIRELRNSMERIVALSSRKRVTVDYVKAMFPQLRPDDSRHTPTPEEQKIRQALAICYGDLSKAAQELGISRLTLWRRMSKYAIDKYEL